jgi:hypothetical protein
MSKGPGHVQRAVLALIAAEPDGAWSYERLCQRIYPPTPGGPTRAQLGALGRALQRMTLPGTWTTGGVGGDRRTWLYDECNLASMREAHPRLHEHHFKPGGRVFERVEKAKRFRDAPPLERIAMQIVDVQTKMGLLRMAGALTPDGMKAAAERIKELEAKRAALRPSDSTPSTGRADQLTY